MIEIWRQPVLSKARYQVYLFTSHQLNRHKPALLSAKVITQLVLSCVRSRWNLVGSGCQRAKQCEAIELAFKQDLNNTCTLLSFKWLHPTHPFGKPASESSTNRVAEANGNLTTPAC
eukprot:5731747-Amphidinium_carterae.1